jgi:ribosomal-protein-alanine N-acetyltransferase
MNEIETERLQLRLFRPDDLDELSLIFGDPDVVRYLGSGHPASRADTETALDSIIRHWQVHGFGRWAAICKQTRRLIGYCGLRNFNGMPELVYLLSKQYWGMGLATEMARASLKYGFEERQFERIIAMAKLANVASQRVMRKIGMGFQENAVIFNMEVAFYSINRATYFSELGKNIFTRALATEPAESCSNFNFNENPTHSLPSSPELEAGMVSQ